MLILLSDGGVRKTLPDASPDLNALVIELQGKSGFISEEDLCPMVPCPLLVINCKLSLT